MFKRYLPLILTTVLVFANTLLFIQAIFSFEWQIDNGIAFNEAYRILHGDILYVDFHSFWMPTTTWILTLVFKLFGISLYNVFLFATFIFAGIVTNIYFLGKRLTGSTNLALFSVLLYLLSAPFYGYSHTWVGLLFTLIFANIFLRLDAKTLNNDRDWFFIGIALGLVAITVLWQGGVLWLALLLTISQYEWSTKAKLKRIAYMTAGSVIPLLSLITFMFATGAGQDFLRETLLFVFTKYTRAQQALPITTILIPTMTIYPALFIDIKKYAKDDKGPLFLTLSAFGFSWFGLSAPTTGHVLWAYALLIPILAYVLKKHGKKLTQSRTVWVYLTFIAVILSIELVKIDYVEINDYAPLEIKEHVVPAPEHQRKVVAVLSNNSWIRGHKCTIIPWAPEFFPILDELNPISYNFIGPEHYNDQTMQDILHEIKAHAVDCIIYLDTLNVMYPGSPEPVLDYMLENYELVTPLYGEPAPRHNGVWVRKDKMSYQ